MVITENVCYNVVELSKEIDIMDQKLISALSILNSYKTTEDVIMKDGSILIHRLKTASPLGYLHKIYSPLTIKHLEKIESLLRTSLSREYRDFLLRFNGLDAFNGEISIFGLRLRESGGYFKSTLQPNDIIIQNLGRNQKDGYIQIGTYKEFDVLMAKDGSDKVYVIDKDDILEYPSFYDWLYETISYLDEEHQNNAFKKSQIKAPLLFNIYRLF